MRARFWKLTVILLILSVPLAAKALTSGTGSSGSVSASDDPGEEQYVPIPELNSSAKPNSNDESIFDDVRLHVGASFIDSFQNLAIAQGVRAQGALQGIQFNFGVDLFSPHWICEGDLVNFPQENLGGAQISSNGFELRLLYETPIAEALTLHLGAGVASRGYNIVTTANGSIPGGTDSFSSGATVLVTGADYWVNENFTAGVELADHMPMASGDDPSSMDLGIRLGGHF